MQVLCIVMEHLDLSVREFLISLGNNGESAENTTNVAHVSMEYSISDDEESSALSQQLDKLDRGIVSLKSKM